MKYRGINYELYPCNKEPKLTLVLLHGLTGNIGRWAGYIPELKKDFTILALDLIGHGDSDFPNDLKEYAARSQAENINDLLKKEKIKNVAIVCHSFSFGVAQELMKMEREGKSYLIMISPFFLQGNFKTARKIFEKITEGIWPFLVHKRNRNVFRYPQIARRPSFKEHITAIGDIGVKSYLAHVYHCGSVSVANEKVTNPVLLIYREEDRLSDDRMRNVLRGAFKNLEERAIPGKNHLFLSEKRDELIVIIRDFLRNSMVIHYDHASSSAN